MDDRVHLCGVGCRFLHLVERAGDFDVFTAAIVVIDDNFACSNDDHVGADHNDDGGHTGSCLPSVPHC